MSSRGLMTRYHSLLLSLSGSLLIIACHKGGDAGDGPIDLGTASTSPTSASTDPPTTTLPTTSATSSTSTGALTDTTSAGPGSGSSTSALDTSGTDPETSSSGTTALPPSESCGDAILDPGEECDLGAAENDNQGACTIECELAKCGDQLIWAGKEDCDNGPNNNDVLYGGCTTQCKYGPRCGDSKLQDLEECDLGSNNGTGEFMPDSVPCDDGCRYDAKLVFLSSVAYTGGEIEGAEKAHEKCQALALTAALDNAPNFKAWISDALFNPASDFTHAIVPYVRLDGVRIADDWNDLTLNGPDEGLYVTEKGVSLPGTYVWTGTAPNGTLAPNTLTCQGWSKSNPGDKGNAGLSGVDKVQEQAWIQWNENKQWTTYTAYGCDLPYRIYCFEQ